MPVDIQTVNVDLSIMFGAVQVFCAVNRQPKPTDFDYTNAFSGYPDYLPIVSICCILCEIDCSDEGSVFR